MGREARAERQQRGPTEQTGLPNPYHDSFPDSHIFLKSSLKQEVGSERMRNATLKKPCGVENLGAPSHPSYFLLRGKVYTTCAHLET